MNSNDALSLLEDREGGMWVGTSTGGVNRFPSEPPSFTAYRTEPGHPNSLDEEILLSVLGDSQGILWIGGSKLNRLDRKTGRYTSYRHNPAKPEGIPTGVVHAMAEDRAGFLWLAMWRGGLARFDRRTGQFKIYPHDSADSANRTYNNVLSLLIDHGGTLWAGTDDGLYRLDARTGRFAVLRPNEGGIESRWYRVLAEGADGSIWMGTYTQGLQRLDVRTGEIVAYKNDPVISGSLSNNRVNALCVDHAGTLWVGTQNGLNRFDPNTGKFASFGERDGLPNNAVEGVLEDAAGRLWLSTGNGLSRFDPRLLTFKNYYSEDGLAGDEFRESAYYKSASGEMFFGGVNGVTAFYPEKVLDSSFIPPVVLTEFRLFNDPAQVGGRSPLQKSISYTDALTLSHAQSIFALEFSALSFASPARTRYRYRLEGLEADWNETTGTHRLVTYTTLPAREYHFRVQSNDHRGRWCEPGLTLTIRVLPVWWNMWQFRIIWITSLILLTWFAYRLRLHRMQRECDARIEERLEERTRIARELHDTLLQSLQASLIQMQAARNIFVRRPEKGMEKLDDAITMAVGAIDEGRNAIQDLRARPTDETDLAKLLNAAGHEMAHSAEAQGNPPVFRVTVEGEPRDLKPLVQDEVYRVARELLRNAFRHAQARRIEAEVRYESREFRLQVRDDGMGIDPEVLKAGRRAGHFGLPGLQERVTQLGGRVEFWSEAGAGAEVVLTMPAVVAYAAPSNGGRFSRLRRRKAAV